MSKSEKQEKNSADSRNDRLAEAIGLFSKVVEEGHKKEERSRKNSKIIACITAGATLIGVIATVITTTLLNLHGEDIQRRYEQAKEVQKQIDRKIEVKSQLNNAFINIRASRISSELTCKNGKPSKESSSLVSKMHKENYELAKAGYLTAGVFNKPILEKIHYSIKLLDTELSNKDKNSCATEKLNDRQLQKIESTVNALILKSIEKDKKVKKRLSF